MRINTHFDISQELCGTPVKVEKDYCLVRLDMNEAMKVDPESSLAHANLGYLFLGHGDYDSASEEIEKALKIGGESAYALLIKGRIEVERERYNQAIKTFEKAIRPNLDNPLPLLLMVCSRYTRIESYYDPETKAYKGELFSIIRELERARDICEKDMDRELRECILYFLGYFYYKNNDIFTAKEKLKELGLSKYFESIDIKD